MQITKIPPGVLFRLLEDETYKLSFVPTPTGNFATYQMHWVVSTKDRPLEPFLCYPVDCPICELSKNNPDLRPKTRVLLNVWEGTSSTLIPAELKIWDINLFLLRRAFKDSDLDLTSDALWDPSPTGVEVEVITTRRGSFPEYRIMRMYRRGQWIPKSVLDEVYDLNDMIIIPPMEDYISALAQTLNRDAIEAARIAEIVGDTKLAAELLTKKTLVTPMKTPEKREPEPYKRVKRVIIMEDD